MMALTLTLAPLTLVLVPVRIVGEDSDDQDLKDGSVLGTFTKGAVDALRPMLAVYGAGHSHAAFRALTYTALRAQHGPSPAGEDTSVLNIERDKRRWAARLPPIRKRALPMNWKSERGTYASKSFRLLYSIAYSVGSS